MQSGITLVALVVTIVVLLILAGVSISLVLGNNGIITKTQTTTYKQQIATMSEELQLYIGNKVIETSGNYDSTKLNATTSSLTYNGVTQTGETIKNILTTETDDVLANYSVAKGELKYLGDDSTEASLFAQVIYNDSSIKVASAQSSTGIVTVSDAKEGTLEDYKIYGASVQNGTPTTESPAFVTSFGEDGNISITSCGKNLLDSSKLTAYSSAYGLKFTVLNDGGINFKGTSTRNGGSAFRFVYLNGEHDKLTKLGASYISFGQPNGSIRIDEATGTLAIDITLVLGTNYDFTIYPMAYIGSKPTVYEGYKGLTTTINLSDSLYKIGNVSDYIDYGNGGIVKNIVKKVFNGTENWVIDSTYISLSSGNKKLYGKWNGVGLNSHYNYQFWYGTKSIFNDGWFFRCGQALTKEYNSDTSSWKAYLSEQNTKGTPITVCYQLATPINEYTNLPTIPTYDGTTNVYITDSNGISASNISISYIQK